jgi:ppGpp synthetase/RelA/SpoT-type nucleotidyltranferase
MVSKATLDKAGRILGGRQEIATEQDLEVEDVFDQYRKSHLQPLSETTLELQHWLTQYGSAYYIAQRLKRKPQILRKLRRFSVRLTQLQDIGGCRIIVQTNADVDRLLSFLNDKVAADGRITLGRATDYRERGRDDSGYRAVHLILERSGLKLELQIRSRIQHYWAESIERTSVIYGHYLKELDGDPVVVNYFKELSDLFYEIESGRTPNTQHKLTVARVREEAESIILQSERRKVFSSYVNEGIIKTLIEKEKRLGGRGLNNWIFVFDWNAGSFVSWDIVERDPDVAIRKYVEHERSFPAEHGFEVVLVGSSEVATVRETHSHYFGIDADSSVLETLDESIVGFSHRMDIDVGARQILACMHRKHLWGRKTIAVDTLKNHFCQNVLTFDSSLEALVEKGLVHHEAPNGGVALDIKQKRFIEEYL